MYYTPMLYYNPTAFFNVKCLLGRAGVSPTLGDIYCTAYLRTGVFSLGTSAILCLRASASKYTDSELVYAIFSTCHVKFKLKFMNVWERNNKVMELAARARGCLGIDQEGKNTVGPMGQQSEETLLS